MKKLICIILSVCMALSLIACAAPAAEPPVAEANTEPAANTEVAAVPGSDKITVGVLYCLLSAPAVKVFASGIESKAAELGIDLIELDGGWDAAKQTDQLNSLIAQNVDAIILNPVDSKSIVPAVKKASEAGIPVVMGAMNIDASGEAYVVTYVGADEKDVGRAAGELMKQTLGELGGDVIVVEGKAGTDPQINRTAGFEEAIAGTNINVVAKVAGDFDKAKAMTVTLDALTKYPNIKGIWVHDDTMCVGVVQAMKTMNYAGSDIAVVSYNGSQAGYDMVKAGDIVGTAVQPLVMEGSISLQAAVDAVNGKALEKWYKDEITPITKENVDSYDMSLLW